jgi:ABC-2 type transport system ATP-binding protein
MSVIEVRNLSRNYEYYRKRPGIGGSLRGLFRREKLVAEAVKDISFSIEEGELVGFLGPNGAGKTTTLKVLSGILFPTAGDVRVLGHVPFRRRTAYQKQFALVMGQKNQLWWDLPPRESFVLNKEIYEISDSDFKQSLDEFCELLDIGGILDVPVRKLSLGQRMKCELVTALIHRPKVLFLDEPTIGLDVVAQKNIRDFIKRYNEEKKTTIVLTSHYMEDISRLCRRVIIIDLGRIVYDGPLNELVRQYAQHKLLIISFNSGNVLMKDIERYGEVAIIESRKAILRIPRDRVKETASAILSSNLPVEDILINEMEIDDVIRVIFSNTANITASSDRALLK